MGLSPEKIIETICPELAGSPSLQVYLGMAAEVISRGFFGNVYNQALAYQACHLFTLFDTEADDGASSSIEAFKELSGGAPVTNIKEGGLSISFGQGGSASGLEVDALGSTKFGRLLLALRRSRPTMNVAAL